MTGQELFEKAIHLCGLGGTEESIPTDVKDLEIRATALINIVLAENSILDCRIRKCEHRIISINRLSDDIVCSEVLADAVLPYGLARLFMLGEDDALATDLNKLYMQGQEMARGFGKAKISEIREVYR